MMVAVALHASGKRAPQQGADQQILLREWGHPDHPLAVTDWCSSDWRAGDLT
jgi:hypothetical protein